MHPGLLHANFRLRTLALRATDGLERDGARAALVRWMAARSGGEVMLIAVAAMVIIAGLDWATGEDLAFAIFYALPVALAAWFGNRAMGLVVALLATGAWDGFEVLAGHDTGHPLVLVWNAVIRGSFLVLGTLLLSALNDAYRRESEMARTDALTGAANRRAFVAAIGHEIERSLRAVRPFTLAYVDLDHFKRVNDTMGHHAGDRVLRVVASTMSGHARGPDVVARLGGDEFGILLPETDEEGAASVLKSLHATLLEAMARNEWPTGFSVGAVTFRVVPRSPEEALRAADDLAIEVKRTRKGGLALAVADAWPGPVRRVEV